MDPRSGTVTCKVSAPVGASVGGRPMLPVVLGSPTLRQRSGEMVHPGRLGGISEPMPEHHGFDDAASEGPVSIRSLTPPTSRVAIRPYEPGDADGITRLRESVYPCRPEAHDVEWHRGLYAWLADSDLADQMSRWVIDAGGEVVGHLAAVPQRYRERQKAATRYLGDRDVVALQRTMARLDAEASEAKTSDQVIDGAEALAWLRDLPALWKAGDDSGRRLLTEALFEKVEVLGVKSVTIHPTPEADAHGWSDAFGPEPLLIAVGVVADAIGTDGRGERI